MDPYCSSVTLGFSYIAYSGWSSFDVTDSGHHVVWQGTVDSNTAAPQTFHVSLPPGTYVLNLTGQGSYTGSGSGPEWAVTITEA